MSCKFPLQAVKCLQSNSIKFLSYREMKGTRSYAQMRKKIERMGFSEYLMVPCGQCICCRLERSRQTAVRCMHEAESWSNNVFVTLTYSDRYLPSDRSVSVKPLQDFYKRLRDRVTGLESFEGSSPIRYYNCGEYGEKKRRPHFHTCLFNLDFEDKYLYKTCPGGHKLYRSPLLEKIWPFGMAPFGSVTFESAAYCARYILKKRLGKDSKLYYESLGLKPEFNAQSLKPGLGYFFYKKYFNDIYPSDEVIVKERSCRVPRYYDKLLERTDPILFEQIKKKRKDRALENTFDSELTYDRFRVKAEKKALDIKKLIRPYEFEN